MDSRLLDGDRHINLELKARLSDLDAARRVASALGATPMGLLRQRDTYFQVPRGRLKLREMEGEIAQLIYYERAEDGTERWSHYRITPVADPAGMIALLTASLGCRGVVAKVRELWLWQGCRLHLDEVAGLGTFLEFEVISAGDTCSDWDRMEALMTRFGLSESDSIRTSYADLAGLP